MLFSATRVCALLPQPREADSLPGAGRASLRPCGLPGLPVGSGSPTDGGLGHAPGLGLRSVSSGQAGRAKAQQSLAQRSLAPFSPPLRTAHLLFSPGPGMGSGRGRGAELQPARTPCPRRSGPSSVATGTACACLQRGSWLGRPTGSIGRGVTAARVPAFCFSASGGVWRSLGVGCGCSSPPEGPAATRRPSLWAMLTSPLPGRPPALGVPPLLLILGWPPIWFAHLT